MARKKKVLTEQQKTLLKGVAEQLKAARKRARLSGPELAPLVGWASPSSVSKTEAGNDAELSDVLSWAEACGHEVVVTPKGSVSVLAARLDAAEEGERRVALELLDLLAAARAAGDKRALRRVADDLEAEWDRLKRHSAADAS